MNWRSLASNAGLHRSNGSVVPGGPMNAAHDEILPSGSGFNSDVNTTGRPGQKMTDEAVASRGVAETQSLLRSGANTHDTANSSSRSSVSESQSQSLGTARPVCGRATDMDMMDMDLEDEKSTDNKDNHHSARTELSINTPTSMNMAVIERSSTAQEEFIGGFGTGSKYAVLHPTLLSPRSPVGAGDSGLAKLRVPKRLTWCGGTDTSQAQEAQMASATSAAGKAKSRNKCGDCGSVVGMWGADVPSDQSHKTAINKSCSDKSCGSCGEYVVVGREAESRLQDRSKTSTTFTTPSAPESAVDRDDNNNKGGGKGSSKGEMCEHRRMSSGTKGILLPVNKDGGNHGGHGGHVHGAKWVSHEARLRSLAEDEDQVMGARDKQCKRRRGEEDSAPTTTLSTTDSRLARRCGNDIMTPMPRLFLGQSGDDSATHASRTPSSGSVGGGGRGGMSATPVETRSDPPSDPVSKRRKSDQSHGDSSPFKSSVMVAARSKYRIVHHRGFSESGEMVGGSSDGADGADTGALDEASATDACKRSTYSPGISTSSRKRRHDGISSYLNSSSSSSYRRRYRDEYSKSKLRRRQGAAPSPEATGTCAAPRTPTATVAAVKATDSSVDPTVPILVVIDGSNVAFSFRQDVSNPRWSPQGILLAVKFFQERGVPVVAFVPRPRVDSITPGSEHYDAFMHAMRDQAIATVPSKANDDLFILQYAIQRSAHIVSNDQFRDHLANASTLDSLGLTKDQLRTFLVDNHVSYTFARDEFVANPEAAIIRMLTKQTAGIGSEVRRTGPCTT